MKIIIASDSFKGTLSSKQVESILKRQISKKVKAEILTIPIADGGEGILEVFKKIKKGKSIKVKATGPNFMPVKAEYLLSEKTAVIEMAKTSGLTLANPKSAKFTTTFGVGELILDAEKRGATDFIIGLGGSATNDAGCGMASALGNKFFDVNGKEFIPIGATLKDIEKISFGKKRKITALCDVKNPLYGDSGAAKVFARQKGATEEDIDMLDNGLKHFSDILIKQGVKDFNVQGSGAAGGLGAGILAFNDGELKRGIDVVLDYVDFDKEVLDADYVITGEGSLDSQSFSGKVIDGIIKRCNKAKVIAVVGISKTDNYKDYGISQVFESNFLHKPFCEVEKTAKEDLVKTAKKVAEYLKGMV